MKRLVTHASLPVVRRCIAAALVFSVNKPVHLSYLFLGLSQLPHSQSVDPCHLTWSPQIYMEKAMQLGGELVFTVRKSAPIRLTQAQVRLSSLSSCKAERCALCPIV